LRQVLINLVGNALKFTNKGQVAIYARLAGATPGGSLLEFTVSDTGIGIPEEKQKKIFEAFAQADMSTTRRYGGTGLGLSICQRLVHLMGGRIWVESEEGRGSTFHFTTTVLWNVRSELNGKPCSERMLPVGGRILTVDDNPLNGELLKRLLPRWNMTAVPAASAREALAQIMESQCTGEKFSTIMIEKELPSPGGLELVAKIRASPAGGVAMILVHSHLLDAEERDRCEQLGVTRTILKPFRRSTLYEVLRACHGEVDETHAPAVEKLPEATPISLRILLAEDNAVNQRLISKLLEKMGHVVTIVGDGQLALRLTAQREFDLVAMDMQMPVMDGVEATEKIRAREKHSALHLPIMAMTASAFEEDRQRCLRAGMDGYVVKPVTSKAIEMEIARVMDAQEKYHNHEAPQTR
jgi:CheY-like chemotaxis protein